MKVWYEQDGKRQGPVDVTEVASLVTAGVIKDETLVWHKFLDDWTPFKDTKQALLPQPGSSGTRFH